MDEDLLKIPVVKAEKKDAPPDELDKPLRKPGALYLREDEEEKARRKLHMSRYIKYVRPEAEAHGINLKEVSAVQALRLVEDWYYSREPDKRIYATKGTHGIKGKHFLDIPGGTQVRGQTYIRFWIVPGSESGAIGKKVRTPEEQARLLINKRYRKRIRDYDGPTQGLRAVSATDVVKMIESGLDHPEILGIRTGTGTSPFLKFFIREPKKAIVEQRVERPRTGGVFSPEGRDFIGIINKEHFSKVLPRARASVGGMSKEMSGEGFKYTSAQPSLSSAYLKPNIALGKILKGEPVYGEQDESGRWVAFYSKPMKARKIKRKSSGQSTILSRAMRYVIRR